MNPSMMSLYLGFAFYDHLNLYLSSSKLSLPILNLAHPIQDYRCHPYFLPRFKYRLRDRLISLFLPATDTIWGNRSPHRLQQKNGRYLKYRPISRPISADKLPDISPDMK